MRKNVQLPMSAIIDMYRLIIMLDDYELDCDTRTVINRLEEVLRAKVEAEEKRRAYSEYKMAPDDESKEAARQKYLDLTGIHRDWRLSEEADRQRREQ